MTRKTDVPGSVSWGTMRTFVCHDCGQAKPVLQNGGTGYALDEQGNKICYECCAERDKKHLKENDKALLYLTRKPNAPRRLERSVGGRVREYLRPDDWEVINWPGTLRFQVLSITQGEHNLAGVRFDVKFRDHLGRLWHGTQYGRMTQVVRCRRVKERKRG